MPVIDLTSTVRHYGRTATGEPEYSAVIAPLRHPESFAPYTHGVTLWHGPTVVNFDVAMEAMAAEVADRMLAESI